MRVAIIDYGSGNLRSATKAFERASHESGAGARIELTDDPERVRSADRVVLPGVGAYADCRRGLDAVPGMVEALRDVVENKAHPFLGICVGMQLMSSRGLEKTVTKGLDWIKGDVKLMTPSDPVICSPVSSRMPFSRAEASAPPSISILSSAVYGYFRGSCSRIVVKGAPCRSASHSLPCRCLSRDTPRPMTSST